MEEDTKIIMDELVGYLQCIAQLSHKVDKQGNPAFYDFAMEIHRLATMGCLNAKYKRDNLTIGLLDVEFTPFPSISRLSRDMVITEKLDGTNASICVYQDGEDRLNIKAGSRTRWITPEDDNYGFAKWVHQHQDELIHGLGEGTHFGEWWGQGIQCGYGLKEKRFSLFNVGRWNNDNKPACCHVVPTLYRGNFSTLKAAEILSELEFEGSIAVPGFMQPEGIVIYHAHSNTLFKKTIKNDEKGKSYGS